MNTAREYRPTSPAPPYLMQIIMGLLAVLFLWKGISGWWHYTEIELSFRRQRVFGDWASQLAQANIALLILSGMLLGLGVAFHKLRFYSLGLSAAILAGYAVYAQLVLLDAFGNSCACISWFAGMSWTGVLAMNAFLLLTALTLFFITLKERRPP